MKKGFTLLEIIVAFALITVITATAFAIFFAIENVQRETEDKDQALIQIQNIHQLFVTDPTGWQGQYFIIYDVYENEDSLPENFNIPGEEKELYYDQNWQLLENENGMSFGIVYDYLKDDTNVYTLYILEIYSKVDTLFTNIDLGEMGVYNDGT
jgi:prepilin-type N-terminal cleavage/methylation domain-containing protein